MQKFIVEEYAASGRLGASVDRARAAGAELAREGVDVRHERSVLLVEDQVALHVFTAESADAASEAARRAAIGCDRVHRAVEQTSEGGETS